MVVHPSGMARAQKTGYRRKVGLPSELGAPPPTTTLCVLLIDRDVEGCWREYQAAPLAVRYW